MANRLKPDAPLHAKTAAIKSASEITMQNVALRRVFGRIRPQASHSVGQAADVVVPGTTKEIADAALAQV